MQLIIDQVEPDKTFLNGPYVPVPEKVETPYAFVGIPFGPPYHAIDMTACARGATEVRWESHRRSYALNWDHYDFDLGTALFPDGSATVSDCGEVPHDFRNPDKIWDDGIAFLKSLVGKGVVPLVVGGFDSIPPIVAGAFESEQINILHVDSHLDFRHERYGIARGYSSPIRRIREYPWVNEIVQVGLRGAGSARQTEVDEAVAAGNRLVTAWELHETGAKFLLKSLSAPGRWVITIDCDGLDTSIAPAIGAREPGGLTFDEIRTLVGGLAEQNKVAALVFTEYQPDLDIQEITAHTITRLMINVIGKQRQPKTEVKMTHS